MNEPIYKKADLSALPPPRAAQRLARTLSRLSRLEAFNGIMLLGAAAIALLWANSPWAESYHHLWHIPVTIGFGDSVFSRSLHFWINDALMTLFFLVVGMDIRHEMHDGVLANLRTALLPLVAAAGGVIVPAAIYLGVNGGDDVLITGWAVPTATDIAFSVGVLALLGRGLPPSIRVFLLALAVIDDIAAVLIIAVFYSGGLDPAGFIPMVLGVALIFGLRQIGATGPAPYVIPGVIVWLGMLQTGAHPTLAGVLLGMLTPVHPAFRSREALVARARMAIETFDLHEKGAASSHSLASSLKALGHSRRYVLPTVVHAQMSLHPWVSFVVMPLFALANAGVTFGEISLDHTATAHVLWTTALALVLGKPVGILLASFIAIKLRLCKLPADMGMGGLVLIGLLAGIGFTMAIFVANLAFENDPELLGAAKLGVVAGSALAAVAGLLFGMLLRRLRANTSSSETPPETAA